MELLITSSILLAAGVALAVYAGAGPALRWLGLRARADARKYERWAEDLFVDWRPEYALRVAYGVYCGALAVALLVYVLIGSPVFGLVFALPAGAAVALWFPGYLYGRLRGGRLKRLEEQLPEAINVMVSAARAGMSLPQAVESVARNMPAPVGEEFRAVSDEHLRGGLSMDEALARARRRIRQENFTMVFTALIINNSQGGDVLHILEEIGTAARELSRLQKKIVTETTEVRMQQKVIFFMTPVFFVLVLLFDDNIKRLLLNTLPGKLILLVVFGVQVACFVWVNRIVKAAI